MNNVGGLDKILRLILGLVLISLVFVGPQTLWGLSGLILIVTGFINFCPIYKILGLNTGAAKD